MRKVINNKNPSKFSTKFLIFIVLYQDYFSNFPNYSTIKMFDDKSQGNLVCQNVVVLKLCRTRNNFNSKRLQISRHFLWKFESLL